MPLIKQEKAPLEGELLPTSSREKAECHRWHVPSYEKPLVNIPIMNQMKGKLLSFDWHKCPPMAALRANGGKVLIKYNKEGEKVFRFLPARRKSIRTEREETLRFLTLAIMNNVEYSYGATYLHECMLSIQELAQAIGQLHKYEKDYTKDGKYRHGRVSYDPVLGAIDDLEAAGLILVVREFDHDSKQYKASRIFLTPLMFQSLGMTGKDTKKLMDAHKKYNHKHSKPKFRRSRPLTSKMANINSKGLISQLNYHRRWFNGELEAETLEEKYKAQLEQLPGNNELSEAKKITLKWNHILSTLPLVQYYGAEESIKKEHPELTQIEVYQRLIDRFTN